MRDNSHLTAIMCKRWETDANLVSRSYSCEHVIIWIIAESLLLYIFILTRIRSYWNSQGKNSLGLVSGTKRVCLFSQTLFRFGNSSIKKAFFRPIPEWQRKSFQVHVPLWYFVRLVLNILNSDSSVTIVNEETDHPKVYIQIIDILGVSVFR